MQESWWMKLLFLAIGAIIGFGSSLLTWRVQEQHHEKTLARGLLSEVSSMEPTLHLYAKTFDNPGPGAGKIRIDQPLYVEGLYEQAGKDIFALDPETARLVFDFYTALRTAERDRTVDESSMFFAPANEEMKKSILQATAILPELKGALQKKAGQ
jgi:hypothetical protein